MICGDGDGGFPAIMSYSANVISISVGNKEQENMHIISGSYSLYCKRSYGCGIFTLERFSGHPRFMCVILSLRKKKMRQKLPSFNVLIERKKKEWNKLIDC